MAWTFCFFVLFAASARGVYSQFLNLRACNSSGTVVASRLANAVDSNAQTACNVFCGNSSNVGTYLYNYYCAAALGLGDGYCLMTSYGYIAPTNPQQTQVPTITSNTLYYDVPCNYVNTPIGTSALPALLGFSNPGSQNWVVNQQVVASSPSDTTVGYIYVDPVNGTIYRGAIGPRVDTTQTIAFTLSQTGTAVYSNTVYVTFQLRSCALQINGPDQVNIYACCFYIDYSALRFTVTTPNAPQVIWDSPSNSATNPGLGMPDPPLGSFQGGGQLLAPDILFNNVSLGTDNNPLPGYNYPIPAAFPQTDDLFIVNENGQAGSPCQSNQNGPVGCYGSNEYQNYFFLGCQQLLFSAAPVASYVGPLQTGSKVVTVCGIGNSPDGRYCNDPRSQQSVTTGTAPNQVKTVTQFIYGNGVTTAAPGLPLPPTATGGTLDNLYYEGIYGADPATGFDRTTGLYANSRPVC